MRLIKIQSLSLFVVCLIFFGLLLAIPYGNEVFGQDSDSDFDVMNQYCIDNADRVAAGENVINELIAAGLVESFYASMTCAEVHDMVTTTASEKAFGDLVDACVRDPDCAD